MFFFVYFQKNGRKKVHSEKDVKLIGMLNGVFYFLMFYFFTLALKGNLAVVYTINSFSLLVPIILSIFIYKEHFDMKKGIAIALTILSLFFFR
ncbi:EamA family transporter [Candidatus Woesearchaeota archaeon]|nr:EamA family transporter [Nanoarchaeota archaeon]MCB9370437.1 EamA family transporter [Candidatus Woesearchaeota archaeon]USN43515.1 MAG: EamA family transporter [Candidatus Woesearchaeota archaeon]